MILLLFLHWSPIIILWVQFHLFSLNSLPSKCSYWWEFLLPSLAPMSVTLLVAVIAWLYEFLLWVVGKLHNFKYKIIYIYIKWLMEYVTRHSLGENDWVFILFIKPSYKSIFLVRPHLNLGLED